MIWILLPCVRPVFDLGLRSATSSSVIDLLRSKLALDDGDEALDPEQVDGQIHKLTLHRQRVRELVRSHGMCHALHLT